MSDIVNDAIDNSASTKPREKSKSAEVASAEDNADAIAFSSDNCVEMYGIVAGLWDSECDRYWARNNIFLILQGALLAGFTAASTDEFLRLAMALLGVLLCFIWFGISVQGAYYVARWRPALEAIEAKMPIQPLSLVKSDADHFRRRSKGIKSLLSAPLLALRRGGSTTFMHYAILIIGISWIALTVLSIIFVLPEGP